jgi:DNA-dependent protein kinase catalytic subunit
MHTTHHIQLLTLMNGILSKDGPCAGAGLKVRTYSVIPLSTDIGLLEWVPHTTPIKGFIGEGVEKMTAQSEKSSRRKSTGSKAIVKNMNLVFLKLFFF